MIRSGYCYLLCSSIITNVLINTQPFILLQINLPNLIKELKYKTIPSIISLVILEHYRTTRYMITVVFKSWRRVTYITLLSLTLGTVGPPACTTPARTAVCASRSSAGSCASVQPRSPGSSARSVRSSGFCLCHIF